jgi:hypothetical protein
VRRILSTLFSAPTIRISSFVYESVYDVSRRRKDRESLPLGARCWVSPSHLFRFGQALLALLPPVILAALKAGHCTQFRYFTVKLAALLDRIVREKVSIGL